MTPMLETIGHYRIRRKIGEGGMGVVYEAWDQHLERAVAIKTIHEGTGSKDAQSRLWREARSLARVNHPRVCQVFDVLEDGEVLVLVLELLDGQSLADRLADKPVTTSEAVGIERQILESLQALHDLDIVHRDLKPLAGPKGSSDLGFSKNRDAKSVVLANCSGGPIHRSGAQPLSA
jgi:serine/threonine protein kinase